MFNGEILAVGEIEEIGRSKRGFVGGVEDCVVELWITGWVEAWNKQSFESLNKTGCAAAEFD